MINVSGSNLGIGISLIMRDGFSGPAMVAGANMDKLQMKAHRLATQQMTMARNANAMGAAIGGAAIYGLSKWVSEGAKFNYTMKYVSAISGGVGKEFDRLNNKAVTLGESTMFTAHQISDGMRWMAQAGMDANSIYNSMGAIANLAGATMSNIEGRGGAADWVTNVAKAFDITLNEKNVTKISDVIAVAVNKSNTKLYEFGEAMKYAQSTAKDLSMTFEETSAGIMVLANAGIQGTMAGTALENMMRYVTKAAGTSATKRQIRALGILGMTQKDLQDAKGDLLSYGTILTKVSKIAGTMGNVDAQNALIDLFGVRGKRGASTIARKLMDYYKFLDDLNNSGGKAKGWMDDMMGSAQGSILQLTSAWTSFKIAFFESLEPVLVPFIKGMTGILKVINAIARTGIGKVLMIAGSALLIMKTAGMAFRTVLYTVKLLAGDVGMTVVNSAARGTAGLNTMTNAANRAAAAMGNVNAMSTRGGMGYLWNFATGGKNKNVGKAGVMYNASNRAYDPATGRFLSNKAVAAKQASAGLGYGKTGFSSWGKHAGKGLGIGLLGSMAVGMASGAVGTESNFGKGLGVASDALTYGLTGASIGTFFGPMGTLVGGIGGTVGGLLWGLYDKVYNVKEELDSVDMSGADDITKAGKWKKLLSKEIPKGLEERGSHQQFRYQGDDGGFGPFFDMNKTFSSNITINLNGESVYEEKIDEPNADVDVSLGLN